MAALDDVQLARGVHLGHGVVVAHGRLGQGAERIEPGHRVRGSLHPFHLGGNAVAQLAENLILELVDPLAGGEQGVFQFLEFLREVALVGDQRLFADIAFDRRPCCFMLFYHLFSTFSAKPGKSFTRISVPSSRIAVPVKRPKTWC